MISRKKSFYCQPWAILLGIMLWQGHGKSALSQVGEYCRFEQADADRKEQLRLAAFGDNASYSAKLNAVKQYLDLVTQHKQQLEACRRQSWLQTQGVWLRLYPCDLQNGRLEALMDRIVNQGYNQVFVEVLSDGKVLLPESANTTAWNSLVTGDRYKDADLLKLAIEKGRSRGLKVHAWLFAMNFGKGYAQGVDYRGISRQSAARQEAIARNGNGDSTISIIEETGKNPQGEVPNTEQLFIDPYNRQAQIDLYLVVNETLRRNPDGVVFDYIRYKRGAGAASIVSNVRYLWIYGQASLQALRDRAQNQQGRALLERFLQQGFITNNDLLTVKKLYPQETTPLWQGLPSSSSQAPLTYWQNQIWRLAVGHAFIGVTYFLDIMAQPVLRQGITAGVAFFSDGNQPVGNGFDSRMQPWHVFRSNYEWQPMAYAVCGKPDCIVNQVRRVFQTASPRTKISPILVGQWGSPSANRPSLEVQMQAIRTAFPSINSISHFAFSWQNEQLAFTRSRQFCNLSS